MKFAKLLLCGMALVGGFAVTAAEYQFDTSKAPDLADWTNTKLRSTVETWYPKLCEMLASEGFKPAETVRFRFLEDSQMRGTPAWTAGNEISLNHQWFVRNLQGEALGCVVHEMVHVVQAYRGRVPGWVQEGLADYIRWFLYEPEKNGARVDFRNSRIRYDGSYRVTANFMAWVERRHGDAKRPIFQRLNALCRSRRYSDDFWQRATGKDLAALDAEWKSSSKPVRVKSPDGQNSLRMQLTRRGIELAVARRGQLQATVVLERQGYRDAEDAPNGRTCEIEKVEWREVRGKAKAPVYKKGEVDLAAKELVVRFKGKWGLILHARNDGVAYRLFTEREGERFLWCTDAYVEYPSKDTKCWAGANNGAWNGDKFQNSWESVFKPTTVGELGPFSAKLYYLPFVTENGGVFTAFTESDLRDYPGVDLVHKDDDVRRVRFWHVQKPSETQLNKAWQRVLKRRDGFAQVQGTRKYPWRVFIMGDNVAELAAADTVWALAEPADEKADFSWVKPGITSWEWWSSMGVGKVPFSVGPNTETYMHFIDFSAEYGLPYYLVDAGWTVGNDIHQIREGVDFPKIMAHAKAKGVGVILWVSTSQLIGREEAEVAYLASLGAAGLKIDFLDRDDQDAVLYVEKVAAAAAKHRLVIDWHGMFKPTGLERKYPNILNYEGIFGLEISRWDPFNDMPRHDCQATFTRMVAGPMDYTPGGMRNLTRAAYKPTRERGKVPTQGTRVHQMALMALYFAPLQMMADGTAAYRANPECARFMAKTPTVWDDTVAIPSEMGKTAALARRKGDTWYLAAIGDWEPRTLELSTKFLNGGKWRAEAFEDAADADQEPTHWKRREFEVRAGESIQAKLAPGGGFIVRLTPAK